MLQRRTPYQGTDWPPDCEQALCCVPSMPPVAAQNSKSSISRENFLFFEKFSLISANVEPV
jgi:hypothetical protein